MGSQFHVRKIASVSCGFVFNIAKASRIAAYLFLFIQLTITAVYAQDDEVGSDSDYANQDIPSAAAANNALGRFDFSVDYVSQDGDDQTTIEAQFTQVFATHHQVTMIAPLIDEGTDSSFNIRAGDLQFGYSYTPGHALTANPWVPSDVGIGFGLSIPTGDPNIGTGLGSYVLAPRLGFIKTFGSNFVISPTLKYQYSFKEQADGIKVREWVLGAPMTYVGKGTFWIQWIPTYLYDAQLNDGAIGNSIVFGKVFRRHFGMSMSLSRLPTLTADQRGVTTDYANSYMVSFHVPYGYQR